jgi:hypothetical protein
MVSAVVDVRVGVVKFLIHVLHAGRGQAAG